ncbi:MAG: LytTR family DNA-binding domain-containing protein [Bacteroidota bacterium]|nr:LytTR family DNA-binding domain-containing protein [Bacteroidota bacterium]
MNNVMVQPFKTIAVEDEPMALEVMVDYIGKVPGLELVATFRHGMHALDYLRKHPVDLMFLDINMPDLSGMELARLLQKPPKIIFTTAYSEYAVEGFEVEAVDYLLKPVDFARFVKACERAMAQTKPLTTSVEPVGNEETYLLIKSGTETHKVSVDEVHFLEGSGNYVTYHTAKGKIMSLQTMKELEASLPAPFVRIHKSYIINLKHLNSFEAHQVSIGKSKIPLSQAYRDSFFSRLRQGK